MKQQLQARYTSDILDVDIPGNLIPFLGKITASKPHNFWINWLTRLFARPFRLATALYTLDILAASLGLCFAFLLKIFFIGPEKSDSYFAPIVCYVIYLIGFLYLKDGYHLFKDKRPELELQTIITANIYAFILMLATNFIFSKGTMYSRYVFFIGLIFTSFLLILFRFGLKHILKALWIHGYAKQNVIIVGNSYNNLKRLLNHLNIQRYYGFNILGYVSANPLEKPLPGLSHLGTFEQLRRINRSITVDKVFFAMKYSSQRHHTLVARLEECSRLNIPALIISEIFNNFHFSLTLDGYTGVFQVTRPALGYDSPVYLFLKRLSDILASLILLIGSFPIWVAAMAAIKFQDRGPIFFRHRLVGKDGKLFDMLKFRTMVFNAQEVLENNKELLEKFRANYKLDDDPRITRIGKWLRKTSLDELPQLINILKGEMSLVGPRPVKKEELARFGDFTHERIKVRPGLTGFWQVSGRCNTNYSERIQMDRFYLNKCSIWLDLVILLKTPLKVLKFDGAM
jgi:exopolysaccharide biosynthesis polyprenyl glycosylphosphotransferase